MKLVLLILGLLLKPATPSLFRSISEGFDKLGDSISEGFKGLTNSASKAADAIENKFDTLTQDAKEALGLGDKKEGEVAAPTLEDTLKVHISTQSLVKTQVSEHAIQTFFEPHGELNPQVLDALLFKGQQQFLERDYHMELSKASIRDIIDSMDELATLESRIREYRSPDQTQMTLIGATSLNQQIYSAINQLFDKRTSLKKDMLVLSQNLDYMRRTDFDLSGFYFSDKYQKQEDFLMAHPGATTEQIYNLYSAQKDVFENRVDEMETIYQQFNRNMADIFDSCEKVYAIFLERQKRAELSSQYSDDLDHQLAKIFEGRREFAEHLLIYQNSLDNIALQRDLFATIFDVSEEMEEVSETVTKIDHTFSEEKDFDVGLTDRQKKRLEDLRRQAAKDQEEMSEEIEEAVQEANDPTLSRQEREERRQIREAKIKAYLERSRVRQQEIDKIVQSLKDAQLSGEQIDESESDEEFFKRREKEAQTETVVKSLKRKIDKGEITMAEVSDRDIADRIAQKEIEEAKQKGTVVEDEAGEDQAAASQVTVVEEPEKEAQSGQSLIPDNQETEGLGPSVFENTGRKLLIASDKAWACGVVVALALVWR